MSLASCCSIRSSCDLSCRTLLPCRLASASAMRARCCLISAACWTRAANAAACSAPRRASAAAASARGSAAVAPAPAPAAPGVVLSLSALTTSCSASPRTVAAASSASAASTSMLASLSVAVERLRTLDAPTKKLFVSSSTSPGKGTVRRAGAGLVARGPDAVRTLLGETRPFDTEGSEAPRDLAIDVVPCAGTLGVDAGTGSPLERGTMVRVVGSAAGAGFAFGVDDDGRGRLAVNTGVARDPSTSRRPGTGICCSTGSASSLSSTPRLPWRWASSSSSRRDGEMLLRCARVGDRREYAPRPGADADAAVAPTPLPVRARGDGAGSDFFAS
jgi:hypothetical protein